MDQIFDKTTVRLTESESLSSGPTIQPLTAGTMVDDRYLIIRSLGHGGFGSVYLASDEKVMSRRVVLKVLKVMQDEWTRNKFQQEIEALTRLDHPGIVGIYDTGNLPGGNPYIVMRYVDGVTLRNFICQEGMPLERVGRLIKQIGSALAAAHEKGIVHRDLKPENIMLQTSSEGEEQVTIIDFGLAKVPNSLVGPSTHIPTAAGTFCYMSPEQLRGERVACSSDIYALGVIAYEMLTGRRPFNPETVAQLAEAQRRGVIVKPKELRPILPERAQVVILHALSLEPLNRYQDPRKFSTALGDALISDQEARDAGLKPKPPHRELRESNRVTDPRQRKRLVLTLGTLIVMLTGILAVIIWKNLSGSSTEGVKNSMSNLPIDSVAVLPFESKNLEAEYISDGINGSLIDELSQVPSMKVIAQTSVIKFKGREVDPLAVGREFKVGAVLSGHITQLGDEFAIGVELIGTRDGFHIWGDQYRFKLTDVLTTQKELSRRIAISLQLRLADDGSRKRESTKSNSAYLLYLQGRSYWNKREPKSQKLAIESFQQAIEKDPTYALAYAGLADCYNLSEELSPGEKASLAKTAALKALDIDDTVAEAHASLALIKLRYEWNMADAEHEFKRALELNPNYASAHQWYASYLLANQRADEALREIRRAQELDPASALISTSLGTYFLFTRDYDQAIEHYHKTLEIEPKTNVHAYLRLAFQEKAMFDEAFKEALKEFASKYNNQQVEELTQAYTKSGYKGLRAKELEFEVEGSQGKFNSSTNLARICAALELKDQAFKWLEKAYEAREDGLIWLKVDPRYDNLRSDPRFSLLVQRVNSPQ